MRDDIELAAALRLARRIPVYRVSLTRWRGHDRPTMRTGQRAEATLHLTYGAPDAPNAEHREVLFASYKVAREFVRRRVDRRNGLFASAVSVILPTD